MVTVWKLSVDLSPSDDSGLKASMLIVHIVSEIHIQKTPEPIVNSPVRRFIRTRRGKHVRPWKGMRVDADGFELLQLWVMKVHITIAITNATNGIIFTIGWVGAENLPRRSDGVLFIGFHQGTDLTLKNLFESSRHFHHYIKRKPTWQLHLKKGPMIAIDMEITGIIISHDCEELPTDRAAELWHSDNAVIEILCNASDLQM
jgi:hypothetical protein